MKPPPKYPALMIEKMHAFANKLIFYKVIRSRKEFYWSLKMFNAPVYTYNPILLNEALQMEI